MNQDERSEKGPIGLPTEILFRGIDQVPAQISIPWLLQNVWWWHHPDCKLRLWLSDQAEGWPNCEMANLFSEGRPIAELTEEQAVSIAFESFRNQDAQHPEGLDEWWAHEQDAAIAYELAARQRGKYPNGAPYVELSRTQRAHWKNWFWKPNLNAIPPAWAEGDPEPEFDPEKWTLKMRFNLRHGDDQLLREFRRLLACERNRLGVPKPQTHAANRRPLNRSFAGIENIDIKTCKTTESAPGRTRQAESVLRRNVRKNSPREIASWNLTISDQHREK